MSENKKKRQAEAEEAKRRADRDTPYLTFLPNLSEGYAPGLHTVTGILTDGGNAPHRWLEDMSRHMETRESSAGYAIPDVLAAEQQLRRLLTLRTEQTESLREIGRWRGVMALLLLWGSWEKDDSWPEITLEDFSRDTSPFASSVRGALRRERAEEGIKVFAISRRTEQIPEVSPLALLSSLTVLVPAADPGDLTELLPACVTWYDAARGGFLDPAPYLTAADRAYLIGELQLLQRLNEDTSLGSLISAKDAHMVGVLDQFIGALTLPLQASRRALERREDDALSALETRVKAVYGLAPEKEIDGLERREETQNASALCSAPLTRALLGESTALPDITLHQAAWTFEGIPFARESGVWLLEGSDDPREAAVLSALRADCDLLAHDSPKWRSALAARLSELSKRLEKRQGLSDVVKDAVRTWAQEATEVFGEPEKVLHLTWPTGHGAEARRILLREYLGMTDAEAAASPFSDHVTLLTDAAETTLGDKAVAAACRLEGENGCVVLPPLSPAMAAYLSRVARTENAPELVPSSFRFTVLGEGENAALEASFAVARVERREEAELPRTVVFHRVYQASCGQIDTFPAADIPTVSVWPSLPFRDRRWKSYYVYAHRAPALDVWALQGDAWRQGRIQSEEGTAAEWQVLQSDTYPDYVLLRRGGVSQGVLPNPLPSYFIKRGESAVLSFDFGTTGTTVMMLQNGKITPAELPCLLRTLLAGAYPVAFSEEFLPNAALKGTRFSAEDIFTDDPAAWDKALLDGHIYTPASCAAICKKNAGRLYYDLKWGDEEFRLRSTRLFLHQVMTEASLAAYLSGAPDVSWRVAMPEAMVPEARRRYLDRVRALTEQVAEDCGVPLTPNVPPLRWASENQAVGAYFRSRNEANARRGYLTLDVGGGTADMALWLGGSERAALSCSLPMGAQSMLLEALLDRPQRLWDDFAGILDHPQLLAELKLVVKQFEEGRGSRRAQQKCRFLLDAFLGEHLSALTRYMNQQYARGQCTFTQALLLLDFAFLLMLAGTMQQQAWLSPEVWDCLSDYMEICMSGRGCLLLMGQAETTRERLKRFIRLPMSADHPVKEHLLVVSGAPKQEVARGLLLTEQLTDAIPAPSAAEPAVELRTPPAEQITSFLLLFRQEFPQAAAKLFPALYDEATGALTRRSELTLKTIVDNHFPGPQGLQAQYAACLESLKREAHEAQGASPQSRGQLD